jgi:hypothetical protein
MTFLPRFASAALGLALAAGLAGCGPRPLVAEEAAPPPVAPPSDTAACDVAVEQIWARDPFGRMRVEARADGPTCGQAVVLLTVRNETGDALLAWASSTQHVFGLAEAATPEAMQTALADWMRQDQAMLASSDKLPDWPEGADQPVSGEFPFYPETWVDRAAWADIRAAAAPLFAFPQGRESMAVYLLRDGILEPIGVQTFPG